jgi:hypothetical protein
VLPAVSRRAVVAVAAVGLGAGVTFAATGPAARPQVAATPVADCGDRVEGFRDHLPAGWRARSVVAGPLILENVKSEAEEPRSRFTDELQRPRSALPKAPRRRPNTYLDLGLLAVLRPDARVTLSAPADAVAFGLGRPLPRDGSLRIPGGRRR